MNITRRVFVTSAIDNLDESGRCEFHGTAMTLTSHLSPGNLGENPPPLCLDNLDQTEIKIPSEFATVPYADEYAGDIKISASEHQVPRPRFDLETGAPEQAWLDHIYAVSIENEGVLQEKPVTYSGYFSHLQSPDDVRPCASIGLLPLFYEKASTMAMQKHAMTITMKATQFLNPGQVPVIVGDCPIYVQQKNMSIEIP